MPLLVLHEHPEQTGRCLASLVSYAQQIPIKFHTIEEAATFIRSQPFEYDAGIGDSVNSAKEYNHSQCNPLQRQRIWPSSYNCWEATAHWLAHALKLLKSEEVIVDIWDRTLSNGVRHVWPTLAREDGIWLVQLEHERQRPNVMCIKAPCEEGNRRPRPAANIGWEDVFGALHYAGAGVLGFFLGADRSAPIVQAAEQAWGSNIADWSKNTKSVAKAGEVISDYAKEKQRESELAQKKEASVPEKREPSSDGTNSKPTELDGKQNADSKASKQTASRSKLGMDWGDI